MVSLARYLNTSGSAAGMFDASLNMDVDEFFQPVLSSLEEHHFKKLDTVPIASVPVVVGMSLEIIGIIFMSVWPEEKSKCDTYFIYLYLHCAYWLLVMLCDHLLRAKHHYLRIYGYLEFYQSTYQQIRVPLFIVSLWTTCYLLLAVILHHTHKSNYEEFCRASEWFTPLNYIAVLTTLELALIVPVYINYIRKVQRFNWRHPPPDVTREEWLSSFTQETYSGNSEVSLHPERSNLEELLEKQADLIRYLRDHNVKLSQRMMLVAARERLTESCQGQP
ncbi:transmembrane protein 192 [Osmia lignaria lignaria]|uniref:transmembrane protein 192 n=1 Tax=Osmia lignaria lignaria TaxID=1437193 RepID=UPI0014780B29|nr:transmembrane protein 192 [Osmia lignaria]XP_034192896.1 transmembrane protein 192 [Osmia lignaria]